MKRSLVLFLAVALLAPAVLTFMPGILSAMDKE
jgi:hypothetical protein